MNNEYGRLLIYNTLDGTTKIEVKFYEEML